MTAKEFLTKERGWIEHSKGMFDYNGLSNIMDAFAESQNKELIEALDKIVDQKFDGRTGVMIQSDMKVIAYKVLKTDKK